MALGWKGPAGEIVQGLTGGIDLIVMATIREGQKFIHPGRDPGRLCWNMDLARFKARRLRQKARLLVKAWPLQDRADGPGAPQVLSDGAAKLRVLDDGLINLPLLRQAHDLAAQVRQLITPAHQIEEVEVEPPGIPRPCQPNNPRFPTRSKQCPNSQP